MSKARTRHKKERLTVSLPPPRNPLAVAALKRRAGSHDKGVKAARQAAARDLKKELAKVS